MPPTAMPNGKETFVKAKNTPLTRPNKVLGVDHWRRVKIEVLIIPAAIPNPIMQATVTAKMGNSESKMTENDIIPKKKV